MNLTKQQESFERSKERGGGGGRAGAAGEAGEAGPAVRTVFVVAPKRPEELLKSSCMINSGSTMIESCVHVCSWTSWGRHRRWTPLYPMFTCTRMDTFSTFAGTSRTSI